MENAADALKIAFAIFVFILAISVTFSLISKAKSTSDIILYYNDKTNFYEHALSKNTNREVGVADIISALYRYNLESMAVNVQIDETTYIFDIGKTIHENIATREEFIKEVLLALEDNKKFTEEFVEVPIEGIYDIGEDGTQITKAAGLKKIYITYKSI